MYKLILQGPALSEAAADDLARQLRGRLRPRRGFVLVELEQMPDRATLQRLRASHDFDINLLPPAFDPAAVRLVISDMDSTLISIECVDEIADFAGLKPQVAAITEAAMRGELDFAQSLRKRVALLRGLPAATLQRVYEERLRLNPGAETLLAGLRRQGIRFALVSGGFTFFTQRLQQRLQLDFTLANELAIDAGQRLTGTIEGDIVDADAKAAFLQDLCKRLGIGLAQAVAIGDGANDLKMLDLAGLGVAYHAKPAVQQQADCAINHCGLEGLLGLLEIEPASEHDV